MKKSRFKKTVSGGTIGTTATLKAATTPLPHFGIEPVMLFTLSGALVYGPIYGFIIGAGVMLIADLMLRLIGLWTLYTALAYGFVGFSVGVIGMFKKRFTRAELAGMAFVLTLFFDAITMAAFAFQFAIPLPVAAINQIPVTIIHTTCNTLLAFAFAPSLMKTMNIISDPTTTEGFWKRITTARKFVIECMINRWNTVKRIGG